MPAPEGNQNAAKGREWRNAINRALETRGNGDRTKALDDLAEKLLENAETGDMSALKELGDRLDGRAAQQLIHTGDSNAPVVHKVIEEIVDGTAS